MDGWGLRGLTNIELKLGSLEQPQIQLKFDDQLTWPRLCPMLGPLTF